MIGLCSFSLQSKRLPCVLLSPALKNKFAELGPLPLSVIVHPLLINEALAVSRSKCAIWIFPFRIPGSIIGFVYV